MQDYFTRTCLCDVRKSTSIPVTQTPNIGKEEMMADVNDAFSNKDADVIFLYYTSHGCNPNGDWAIPKKGDAPGFDIVSLHEIRELWNATWRHRKTNSHLVIIADSCYSGAWVKKIDEERNGTFRNVNISMVASCRANETCYDGPKGGEFTINLLRLLHSHPVYTNNIALTDRRHVPVTLSQPVSSGSLLTDLNITFTSSNQRISQTAQGCSTECYDCLVINAHDSCSNCCTEIADCITKYYTCCYTAIKGVFNDISQFIGKHPCLINCFCFLCCPCIALCIAYHYHKVDSEACKKWYCSCCYKDDIQNSDQNETQFDQL